VDVGRAPESASGYTSEHQSLAILEYFVHLDVDDPPGDPVLAVAEVPDDLAQERVETSNLPANWHESAAPPELARVGDEFALRAENVFSTGALRTRA
jgi:hypothetical protein